MFDSKVAMQLFKLSNQPPIPPEWAKRYSCNQVGLFLDLCHPYDPNSPEGQKQFDKLSQELFQAAIQASILKGKPPLALKLNDAWPVLREETQKRLQDIYQHTHAIEREYRDENPSPEQ